MHVKLQIIWDCLNIVLLLPWAGRKNADDICIETKGFHSLMYWIKCLAISSLSLTLYSFCFVCSSSFTSPFVQELLRTMSSPPKPLSRKKKCTSFSSPAKVKKWLSENRSSVTAGIAQPSREEKIIELSQVFAADEVVTLVPKRPTPTTSTSAGASAFVELFEKRELLSNRTVYKLCM